MKQNSHHVFDQQFTELFKNRIETRIIKKMKKVCRDIAISKPKKAQEQDDFDNKMKYHFHITTLHKYIYIARVKAKHKEAILMYGCYVEVVFHFVVKVILFLCFFGFDIYPLHTFSFFKMLYIYIYISESTVVLSM